jgi:hypothetical protein
MTPTRTRRLSSVIAGCVAMAASLTALGAIVVSDIAEARDSREVFDDELPAASPVKVSKVSVKAEEPALDEIFEPVMPKPRKGKRATIDYGAFEGY